jgi:hypothetical protein
MYYQFLVRAFIPPIVLMENVIEIGDFQEVIVWLHGSKH